MSRAKSHTEFIEQLKKINPQIVPEEEYINSSTPFLCSCTLCGHHWKARPNSLLRGYGCPSCAGNLRKSDAQFRAELFEINPAIEPLELYQGNKVSILCRCKECGHEWKASPNNLLSKKHHCPKCSHKQSGINRRKNAVDFADELSKRNPNILLLETYSSSQTKIKCKCIKCETIWFATPNNLLDKGSGCPNCSHAATSTIEQIIFIAFSIVFNQNEVLSRDKTAIGKELDVFIPSKGLAIEFGAWFWHKYRISGDNEKHSLCAQKGIHLITILEDCPDAIPDKLVGDYRLFQDELSSEKDYSTIKDVLKNICNEYNVEFERIADNWETIIEKAHLLSQKRSHSEFQALLDETNPSVTLIGRYVKSNIKVRCSCNKCGNEWETLPTSLLSGFGCPKCARQTTGAKRAITNVDFLQRLALYNSDIEPLETYTRGDKSIRCRCKKCNNEWTVKPRNLLNGKGCPICRKKQVAKSQSKPIRCIETGICYESVADAQRKTGIYGMHKCAKGNQKTAGGYHWEYI